MLRCVALAAAGLAIFPPAIAQVQRNFPATALRGELAIVEPLDVRMNGRAAVLAPGARIRDENNMLVLSGALVGQRRVVNYTRDLAGNVLDVWLLTAAERAKRPWPTNDAQLQQWSFDPVAQAWSRP